MKTWPCLLWIAWVLSGCDSQEAPPPPVSKAETAYRTHCGTCHQWDGKGIPGMYPPIAGVDWVREADAERLIRVVLHGMVGPLHLNGEAFQTSAPIMPAQGAMLSDERIAEVLTFVMQRFGGRDVTVSNEEVREVREVDENRTLPWTERELFGEE